MAGIETFGTTAAGRDVQKITLRAGDLTASVLTWGAVLQSVRLAGVAYDLTQGSDQLADYEGGHALSRIADCARGEPPDGCEGTGSRG